MNAPRPKLTKARSLEIDRKVAEFIARDARPISTIEGEGVHQSDKGVGARICYKESEYSNCHDTGGV